MTGDSSRQPPIVICRNIVKEFGQGRTVVAALRGVNLEVLPNQLTLLVGPSGCGKTTLLSVVAGILKPTSGELTVLGTDLGRLSESRKTLFRRNELGFVFQQFNLLPALTAAENAAIPLIIAGRPRRESLIRSRELLQVMQMGTRSEALPSELSGGEMQRVAIARALVHEPRLIVCDEPTSALDARTGHLMMELLRDVAVRPDRGVIVVTHDPRVYPFGDRIARMEDGRVIEVERNRENRQSSGKEMS